MEFILTIEALGIPSDEPPLREYGQTDASDMAHDLLAGANGLPAMRFLRAGHDVAWYDKQRGTYRRWEQSDTFDSLVLNRTPSLSRRSVFEVELTRFLHLTAAEQPEPVINKINTLSGIIVFDGNGEYVLERHTPDHLSTIQIPITFAPDEAPPFPERIHAFLEAVLSKEVRHLFNEMAGLLCLPHTRLEKAFVMRGSGANGKSTAIAILRALLGKDNCVSVPISELTGSQFGTIKLMGKLVNFMTEVDFKRLDNSALFKQIVSGEEIFGQDKGKSGFNFTPFCRIVMALDDISGINDVSVGFQRRLEVIDFPNYFDEQHRNIYLRDDLTMPWELEGYFFHLVIPALAYVMRFDRLSPVLDKTGHQRRLQTPISEFVDEMLIPANNGRVTRKQLSTFMTEWQDGDEKEFTAAQLYLWLRSRGYADKRSNGERYFEGIAGRMKVANR